MIDNDHNNGNQAAEGKLLLTEVSDITNEDYTTTTKDNEQNYNDNKHDHEYDRQPAQGVLLLREVSEVEELAR